MSKRWTWYRPRSLDEAVGALLDRGPEAVLVAGGTALCLSPPRRDGVAMIDLHGVGLDSLEERDDEVRIGSMFTAQRIVASCALDGVGAGMLRDTCSTMGPRPVRNRITIGGNVMQAFRWCDLPVALLALDATFDVFGPGSRSRIVGADELFATQPRKNLGPGELLRSVTVRKDRRGQAGAFLKLTQTVVDHAIVSAAVHVTVEGDRCAAARVAVGALTVLPQRLASVESALVGRELSSHTLAEASRAASEADVHGDRRADEAYRREMAAVVVRRALETAYVRARAGSKGGAAC